MWKKLSGTVMPWCPPTHAAMSCGRTDLSSLSFQESSISQGEEGNAITMANWATPAAAFEICVRISSFLLGLEFILLQLHSGMKFRSLRALSACLPNSSHVYKTTILVWLVFILYLFYRLVVEDPPAPSAPVATICSLLGRDGGHSSLWIATYLQGAAMVAAIKLQGECARKWHSGVLP